jgi:hypothetical protein
MILLVMAALAAFAWVAIYDSRQRRAQEVRSDEWAALMRGDAIADKRG